MAVWFVIIVILNQINNMSLPLEAISEFKELYKKDYGIVLSDDEATEKATLLFSALEVTVKTDLTKYSKEVHYDT